MKILFLGGNKTRSLVDWLEKRGEIVIYKESKITLDWVREIKPDIIISYNYKFLIPKEIIELMKGKIINLHISYLPWNKGAHPNVWSFLEDTPKGVSIHYVDEGIDTGPIIIQKEIFFDENKETLRSSYNKLHEEIHMLFKENWENIKKGDLKPKEQPPGGSIHYKRDFKIFKPFIREKGWDTPIKELKEKFMKAKAIFKNYGRL